jgi:hypothetical protein
MVLGGIFGGSKSTNTTDILTRSVVKVMTENIMDCASTVSGTQTMQVCGSYNVLEDSTQSMVITLSVDCLNEAENLQKIQQDVSSIVTQAAESQSQSLIGILGASTAEVRTKVQRDMEQAINTTNLTKIVKLH